METVEEISIPGKTYFRHKLDQNPRISVSIGQKVNLGNYESRDYHFSLSMDCIDGTDEDIRLQKEVALGQVKAWLKAELDKTNEALQSRK